MNEYQKNTKLIFALEKVASYLFATFLITM